MVIVGRITANAKTNTVKGDRQVVNFSIAVNESYKPKGSEAATRITTFFDCSYWINPGIAQYLTKGMLVELAGRVSANAWKGMDGEPKASLRFHVNTIKLHGKSEVAAKLIESAAAISETVEDLPF